MNKTINHVVAAETAARDDWARLLSAEDFRQLREPWLATTCKALGNAGVALLFDRLGDADYRVTAVWPQDATASADLELLAREAVEERQGLVSFPPASGGGAAVVSHLAYPVMVGDTVHGAVAIAIATDDPAAISAAMRTLQWSLGWLRDFLQQKGLVGADATSGATRLALEGIADTLGPASFSAAAHTLAMRLVSRFDLERVSIGFLKRGAASLTTISNTATFGQQMNLVRLIEQAMDEAIDQERAILEPAGGPPSDTIRRAHAALSIEQGGASILTIPLMNDGRIVGALLCEAGRDRGFSQRDVDALNAIAAFAGPLLVLRRQQDRHFLGRSVDALAAGVRAVLGPAYPKPKLIACAVAAVIAAISLIQTDYQINTTASVEARLQRSIVAPYDGFVIEAPLRAGDTVEQGDLIAALDDRDLALEALHWLSERQQRQLEYDKALAQRDLQQLNVYKTQVDQADVRLELIDAKLSQAKLYAPISGVVASGDLTQSIGAAVRRGDVLFEIALLETYRLFLEVDESQISQVERGMSGRFLSTSLPGEPYAFTVSKITPIARPRDGRTVFRVEAEIDENVANLRPGMQGVGKIDAGEASLLWVWTRSFRNWARMAAWSWQP